MASRLLSGYRVLTNWNDRQRGTLEPELNASTSSAMRQQVCRIYLDYLETADSKRRWSIFNDIPWDKLDFGKASNNVGDRVELYCTEELYVPDYNSRDSVCYTRCLASHASKPRGLLKNHYTDWSFANISPAQVFVHRLS